MNWEELPGDQLLDACANTSSTAAWEEFIRRFHPVITAAALRVSRSCGAVEEVDDVVQEIYFKFCLERAAIFKNVRAWDGAALFGLIKVIATNTARDFFRARNARKRGVALTFAMEPDSVDLALPADLERLVTLEQLNQILLDNTQGERADRDRAIFQLYYRDGMTAQAISLLPGIGLNAKGVEGVLHRLTATVRKIVSGAQEAAAGFRSTGGEDIET